MSGPKNIRCRNFNDEGVGECDSGEYCHFVHPGPRWANARQYNNRGGFDHIPKSYFEGSGTGGRGRQGSGGGGGKVYAPRRCRYYEADGTPINHGCRGHPKGECRFTHPDQPGWDTAIPSTNRNSSNSFGATTGFNSLPTGPTWGGSNSSLTRASRDTTVDTAAGSGTGFGLTDTHQSPQEQTAPSLGWGQTVGNETEQPSSGWGNTNNTSTVWGGGDNSGGGGWGGGETNQGWGAGETNNTSTGWGAGDNSTGWGGVDNSGGGWGNNSGGGWGNNTGGGWGSSANNSGSGGWGSTTKDDKVADAAQPEAQAETNPPVTTASESTWGSSNTNPTWGSSDNTWPGSSNNTWGSSNNAPDPPANTAEKPQWGSSGWGASNNSWTASNETSQPEPSSDPGTDKGKRKEWSGWRNTSNSENAPGSLSSGGGAWGNPTPSAPVVVGATQDNTDATPHPDTAPAVMDVERREEHFEGKAIMTALENVVRRRRNKRKRSHENINQFPRYYRHLLDPQRDPSSRVDGDSDAEMGEIADRSAGEEPLEAGEITEVVPCGNDYDIKFLSREPKTSEEKTKFAKHLLYMFTAAATTADRGRKAEQKYEDYKRTQEARIYNYPGYDTREVLKKKLQVLRLASCEEKDRLAVIINDMEKLPSHRLSDVVAYNEHNHLTEEVLLQEQRSTTIVGGEQRLNERHDHLDQNLMVLQTRLEELAKERRARETIRDLPPPVDPDQMAIDEAVAVHQANVQRVIAVETSLQTITCAEEAPHRDGEIQALEESFPTQDCQSLQLQEFAEGIAALIHQVPSVRKEIASIKAEKEQREAAKKAHEENMRALDQNLTASSAQLEALNGRVKELIEGLKHEITIENVKAAVQPILNEHTRVVLEDVQEYVERGLNGTRELIKEERIQMEAHIYSRLVGTQKLFEAVGCYLRSVRADLASLVDKDINGIS